MPKSALVSIGYCNVFRAQTKQAAAPLIPIRARGTAAGFGVLSQAAPGQGHHGLGI